jgi:hypothetical protein
MPLHGNTSVVIALLEEVANFVSSNQPHHHHHHHDHYHGLTTLWCVSRVELNQPVTDEGRAARRVRYARMNPRHVPTTLHSAIIK